MTCIKLRDSLIPASCKGWLLVDRYGLPRYWVTIWADILHADMADRTRNHHLYGIEKLYQHTDIHNGQGSLDRMLASLDMGLIEDALISLLAALRNDAAIRGVNHNQAWNSVRLFVAETLGHISAASSKDFSQIQSRLLRLDRLYSQLRPSKPKPSAAIRALPAVVIDDMYELFSPLSQRNPFRSEGLRWRNFLIFLLMLHIGLRRSEIAVLAADCIKSEFSLDTKTERYWVNIEASPHDDEDPRFDAPGLKTKNATRQLPLTENIVHVADTVTSNYRRKHSRGYLFSSQHNKPMTLRSINLIFQCISKKLSLKAKNALLAQGKLGVSPHDLRHTCAVYRLSRYYDLDSDLDIATERLRVFFGWAPSSPMPRHYARAYFESKGSDIWSETYTRLIEALREIEGDGL